jgi:tryptophan 2,3-dioxygenase
MSNTTPSDPNRGEIKYGDYLNLERILNSQNPPGPDGNPRPLAHHDEMLFVVIHQVYELWFKQAMHEAIHARNMLSADDVPESDVPRVVAAMNRIHEIFRIAVAQFSVLETMTPADFLAFREHLGSASGFQSAQFREFEILAGLDESRRIEYDGATFENHFNDKARAQFADRRAEPSLKEALQAWLVRTPVEDGFADRYLDAFTAYVDKQRELHSGNTQLGNKERTAVTARLDAYLNSCREFVKGEGSDLRCAALFISAYPTAPLLHSPSQVLEAACEFDQWFRIWRFRHARMVERMIGVRIGTGGSSGVGYLDATAKSYRIFHDLMQARSFLVPADLLPPLQDPARFDFAKDAGRRS